jgi:hypothetical protein
MELKHKAAWREVLKELRALEAEYEKVSREKAEHCARKHAEAEEPKPLIELDR